MKKKTLGIIIVSVLGAAAIFCSAMFTHQYLDAKNSKAAFDDLTNLITEIDEPQKDAEAEEADLSTEELAAAEAALAHEKYDALFEQNNDFIGWIKIDGTNVNYPVMQTPNKPDFYLKHSFDKSYSDYGVPYIDEACMTGISNNLVIYGHHMNDGSMFASICNYGKQEYYDAHPVMYLNTPTQNYRVELFTGFITSADSSVYTFFFNSDAEYGAFLEKMKGFSDFDCDVEVGPEDRIITLSTCTYEYDNARYVVMGKLVPID